MTVITSSSSSTDASASCATTTSTPSSSSLLITQVVVNHLISTTIIICKDTIEISNSAYIPGQRKRWLLLLDGCYNHHRVSTHQSHVNTQKLSSQSPTPLGWRWLKYIYSTAGGCWCWWSWWCLAWWRRQFSPVIIPSPLAAWCDGETGSDSTSSLNTTTATITYIR